MKIVTGVVHQGKKLARQLGFPTANIFCPEGVEEGIYEGLTRILTTDSGVSSSQRLSLVYVKDQLLESHILHTTMDLYGQAIEVQLVKFIRSPIPYTTSEAMHLQIQKDLMEISVKEF